MEPITQDEWDAMLAAIAERGDDAAEARGKLNGYACERCRRTTIIVRLRDTGVTPFIQTCPRCGGEATSIFYRVPQTQLWAATASHEYFRPTLDEANRLVAEEPGYRGQLLGGGLVLRDLRGPRSGG